MLAHSITIMKMQSSKRGLQHYFLLMNSDGKIKKERKVKENQKVKQETCTAKPIVVFYK